MENIVQTIDSNLNSVLQNYVQKPTLIRGLVHLLLMLYVVRLAPQPPKQVLQLFENIYFKLFVFSMVLWTAQFSPSTSLLIALAFIVTMNYANTGKVWEYMDNVAAAAAPTAAPTTNNAIEAVTKLAEAAVSPAASNPEAVAKVAEVAMSGVTTKDGADAVKALAQQAAIAEAGVPQKVADAATIAIQSIAPAPAAAPAPVAPAAPAPVAPAAAPVAVATPAVAVEAVKALAQAAASPEAAHTASVVEVANAAVTATTDEKGAAAVKALAEQAMTPSAGDAEKVKAAAETAVQSINGGCYPARKNNMDLVKAQFDGIFNYEDYQSFKSTPQ